MNLDKQPMNLGKPYEYCKRQFFHTTIVAIFALLFYSTNALGADTKNFEGVTYKTWLEQYVATQKSNGVSADVLSKLFDNAKATTRVVRATSNQAEFKLELSKYVARVVSKNRINSGRALYRKNKALLTDIEQRTGVDRFVVTAIWGIESSYGAATRNRKRLVKVADALSTLAWFDKRRRKFADRQLGELIKIVASGVDPELMWGSWAGAMGQTQFIPSSYRAYAADYHGDGFADIWTSRADALFSAANYLMEHKWSPDQPWGEEVIVSSIAQEKRKELDEDAKLTLAEWRDLGVRLASGGELPDDSNTLARLLSPPDLKGRVFLLFENFATIMTYNRSTAYALAVGLLADEIAGRGQVPDSWRE